MDRYEQTKRVGVHTFLDDFLFIAPSNEKCQGDLNNFLTVCQRIGIPIANEKTMGPDRALQFAGITLDTELMETRLPEEKLDKCLSQLSYFCSRKSVTLKELQSLIGLLNFACCVVVPGRAFLRRLIDLTRGVRKPTHHVRLTKESKYDLQVWLNFLRSYNGKSFSSAHAGTLPKPSNYLRTWRVLLFMPRYLESTGFSGNGLPFGKHLTPLS